MFSGPSTFWLQWPPDHKSSHSSRLCTCIVLALSLHTIEVAFFCLELSFCYFFISDFLHGNWQSKSFSPRWSSIQFHCKSEIQQGKYLLTHELCIQNPELLMIRQDLQRAWVGSPLWHNQLQPTWPLVMASLLPAAFYRRRSTFLAPLTSWGSHCTLASFPHYSFRGFLPGFSGLLWNLGGKTSNRWIIPGFVAI